MQSCFWEKVIEKSRKQEYRHFWLLLFWPVYLLVFFLIEHLRPESTVYTPLHCGLDDRIPFCEFFIVFYLFWFIFIACALLYTGFFEPRTFKRLMAYFMLTFSVAVLTYLVFPNCQELRPEDFDPRWWDPFGMLTKLIFTIDTTTNVCPSEHVIGAFAVVFAARDTGRYSSVKWTVFITALAVLICLSTLFIKQHSAVDVLAAVPVCLLGWLVCFYLPRRLQKKTRQSSATLERLLNDYRK